MEEEPIDKLKTIICDDHPAFARGLGMLLEVEATDFEILGVATNAQEAEKMVRDMPPDVVLMDLRMPGTDGIDATRRIRSISPDTKVVILTVSDEEADLYEAIEAGALGFVTKDKDATEIADAVRSVVKGHLVIPANLAGRLLRDMGEAELGHSLTEKEKEILSGIARGETNKEIAGRLHLSERTLSRRLEEMYQKLHLSDRMQAAIWAVRHGLSDPKESGD